MSAAVADDSMSEKSSMMWRDNLSSCSSIQQHHGGAGSLAGSSAAGGGGCSLGAGATVMGPDGKVVRAVELWLLYPLMNIISEKSFRRFESARSVSILQRWSIFHFSEIAPI